jgi:hypothetical protein
VALPDWLQLSTLFGIMMLLVGGVALGASARYIWRGATVYRARIVDRLDGVPTGTLVRVEGTVEADETGTLTAPFSGAACVAIQATVEERRLSPVVLPWDVALHEPTGAQPFRVRTESGTIAISEPTQTVTLERTQVATVGRGEAPPERIRAYEAESSALAPTVWRDPPSALTGVVDLLGLGRRTYSEQRVGAGDRVTVVGRVTPDGLRPLVVSDRTPRDTLWRMSGTSVAGIAIGLVGIALGTALLIAA